MSIVRGLPGSGGDEWNRGAFSAGKTAQRPVNVCDELQEMEVRWDAFSLAPRREHVVCKVEFIVFPAVVLAEESLNRAPRSLDGVRRKNLFGAPSSLSIRRPNDNLGTYCHLRNCSSYSDVMCITFSTIIFEE